MHGDDTSPPAAVPLFLAGEIASDRALFAWYHRAGRRGSPQGRHRHLPAARLRVHVFVPGAAHPGGTAGDARLRHVACRL